MAMVSNQNIQFHLIWNIMHFKDFTSDNHNNCVKIVGITGQFSSVLQQTEMYSVDRYDCEKEHQDDKRPNFRLHSSFSCFKGIDSGTCSGDGGGPIVCPIEPGSEKYMQVNTHLMRMQYL